MTITIQATYQDGVLTESSIRNDTGWRAGLRKRPERLPRGAYATPLAGDIRKAGLSKPKEPLILVEGTQVQVTITPVGEDDDPLDAVIGIGEGPSDGTDNHDKYIYGKIRP